MPLFLFYMAICKGFTLQKSGKKCIIKQLMGLLKN